MDDFNLDLRHVEDHIDDDTSDGSPDGQVTLARLDGSTDPEEWIEAVDDGEILVLAIEGDLNALAAGFARDIKTAGGDLVRFREFLIVTPPGITVDTSRLADDS